MRRGWAAVLLAALLLVVTGSGAGAQLPGAPGRATTSGQGAQAGQLSRDRELVVWAETDSVMTELLSRPGYRVVRYQGDQVRFDAATKLLVMRGKPSAVRRDETILVGDSIIYDDSTKFVVARGDTVILRDPSADDADDFVARGEIRYDLETGEGTTRSFSTSVMSGQRLYVTAQSGTIYNDTTLVGGRRVFFHDADFTYCDHEEPHFHFTARDIKFVADQVVVGRNAVLYIGEVPVFWVPFMFQDARSGRRSGLLTPRFGAAELLRNSTNYQRSVENIGWYFALNDYMDSEVSFDWLSAGSGNSILPGWKRLNSEFNYKWLSRFIDGSAAVSWTGQGDGQRNTSISWRHAQSFNKDTRLNANINWVQNTTVQRQATFDPRASVGTIVSQLNYQTRLGPARLSVGGTRRQYPGRSQTDMDLPNLNLTAGTLAFGPLEWTPSVRFNQSRTDNIDQGLQFGWVFRPGAGGALDSTRVRASRRNTTFGFETPLKIFDFQLGNSFSITERFDDYPEQRIVRDVRDTSIVSTRVFAQRFFTSIDWTPSFNLPRFFQGTWNLSPNARLVNVDPSAGLLVRSELSGGRYVSQRKRLEYGVSAAPTLYGLVPGVGPVERFRHSISPALSYNLSPAADVSDDFLAATGRSRVGYLGSLPRNAVSLSLSTVLEAKLKVREPSPEEGAAGAASARGAQAEGERGDESGADPDTDSAGPRGPLADGPRRPAARGADRPVRLLALNFSSLSYDFILADTTGTGLVENTFTISARTDLLPNLDFRMGYELFQGDRLSDSAVFRPFRNDIGATFSLDGRSGLVALLGRLLGRRAQIEAPDAADSLTTARRSDFSRGGGGAAAGARARGAPMALPGSGQGWQLSLTYNANRQRPPTGEFTPVDFDPTVACRQFPQGSFLFDNCVLQAAQAPPPGFDPGGFATPGGPFVNRPASENVSGNLSFGLTPNWSTSMTAQYDMVRKDFGALQVGLQRELHDWNAVFAFSRAPNGNVTFNFFIALKASPELKFDYNQRTTR